MDKKTNSETDKKINQFIKQKQFTQQPVKSYKNLKTKTVFHNRNLGGHR
jgi:hypothetical protein